jgi:hypothetical protein
MDDVEESREDRSGEGSGMTRQCDYCGNDIKVQIFVGERYCSDNCRKALGIIIREAYKT